MRDIGGRRRVVGSLAAVVLALAGAAYAGDGGATGGATAPAGSPGQLAASGGLLDVVGGRFVPALGDPDRLVTVMVELEGAPVAVQQRQARERGDELDEHQKAEARAALAERQAPVADEVTALGGSVLARLRDAYNGIKVQVPARELPRLAVLAGTRGVRPLARHLPSSTGGSTEASRTRAAWNASGVAATGRDVTIAVVDTGVDYHHVHLGGGGRPEHYAANDADVVEPGSFPTAKVVGGYDFVGDAYDASSDDPARTVPRPDADPMDCNGHGTHVAGTAAGSGVLADGRPHPGPWDDTAASQPFAIGPGVAPEARILALKVFGCDGLTDVTVEAIDWAVAHGADVINLSLGAGFGTERDPSSVAATNAVLAGVVVVAAAGNDGESRHIAGSPAVGRGVLGVGAVDTIETLPMATLTVGGVAAALLDANEAPIGAPLVGTLTVLQDDPATEADEARGCSASDYRSVKAGDVVVTRRGTCPRTTKAELGQAAGAAAVVLVNNEPRLPPLERPIPGVTIPFLGASREDGERIVAAAGQTVTIEAAAPIPNPGYRRAASFTSSGPSPAVLKPEVAAPGVGIVSADAGSGTGAAGSSGTSMASPHVAGVAALVREVRPDWPADLVSAAVVNTADPALLVEPAPWRVGSGMVLAGPAARTRVVATGDPLSPALSYGLVEGAEPAELTRHLTIWNLGDAPAEIAVRTELADDGGGAVMAAAALTQLTVPPGGAQRVPVTLRVDTAAVVDGPRPVGGRVVLEPVVAGQAEPPLRVPFAAVAKAASAVATTPTEVDVPARADRLWFTTTNPSTVPGTLDVYAWGVADATGEPAVVDVRAVGVQAFPGGLGGRGLGIFAIATTTATANPASTEWDVLVDVDEDGAFDYGVIGIDLGLVTDEQLNGTFASVTVDVRNGDVISALPGGGGPDTSVVLLPFDLTGIGVDPVDNPAFDYAAAAFPLGAANRTAGFDVVDGTGSFDPYREMLETGRFERLEPGRSLEWTVGLRRDTALSHPPLGLMIVSLQNRTGPSQAQLIPVRPPVG